MRMAQVSVRVKVVGLNAWTLLLAGMELLVLLVA